MTGKDAGTAREGARLAVLVAASAAVAFAWWFLPLPAGVVVALGVGVVGLALGGGLVRLLWRAYQEEGSAFEAVARAEQAQAVARPAELAAIERAVAAGTATASDAYLRLRPVLRAVLVPGLAGADEEHGPGRQVREAARDAVLADRSGELGPSLWELVRPGRPRPERFDAPGVDAAALEAIVEELEARHGDP